MSGTSSLGSGTWIALARGTRSGLDRGPNPKLELHSGHLSASLTSLQQVAESLYPSVCGNSVPTKVSVLAMYSDD